MRYKAPPYAYIIVFIRILILKLKNTHNMNKAISIVLIVIGLGLGYMGFTSVNDNTKTLKIGDLELSAQKDSESTTGYLMLGAGVILLIGGVVGLTKK